MKNQQKSEFKVGLTVFASVIILIVVIAWAKNLSFFSEDKLITVAFDEVPGLEVGDMVSVRGVRSGSVQQIIPADKKVDVILSINPEIKLNSDAKFYIMMLDLMGGKKVEINPGESQLPIDFNLVQSGSFLGDISTAMAMLSSVQEDLVSLIKEVKLTVESVNNIVLDDNLKDRFVQSLQNLDKLTTSLSGLVIDNKTGIKNLIAEGNNLTKNANQFLNENSEGISNSITQVDSTLIQTRTLISKLNKFIDETTSGTNNAGKLLYDYELFNQIKANITQLRELTNIVIEQMKAKGLKVDAYIF